MILLKNKWNGKNYSLVKNNGKTVVLKREDGSEFEIDKSEYYKNYREIQDGTRKA